MKNNFTGRFLDQIKKIYPMHPASCRVHLQLALDLN